jgi:hypothetical protein
MVAVTQRQSEKHEKNNFEKKKIALENYHLKVYGWRIINPFIFR